MSLFKRAELTQADLNAITVIERTGSVFSLLGCLFIIATFSLSKGFHKPINRLVFYASFGNMMTNVGTLMTRTYLEDINSVGCQFQAFLIQMFMPADAFWTLAMAVNVYLTFYFKFDAERLRRMELTYLICCYGVPFVPAFVYIFARDSSGVRVYGNASLWCWVSTDWDIWRILTFYGPVWIVILVTFFIYIRAGREIYQKRKQLHQVSRADRAEPLSTLDSYGSVKTTEVFVTSEAADMPRGPMGMAAHSARRGSELPSHPRAPGAAAAAYSVTISSNKLGRRESNGDVVLPIQSNVAPVPRQPAAGRRHNQELNNAAWSYTKCAILFFTAILITWIPSSANRVYSVIHPGQVSVPLEFMSSLVLPLQGFWNAVIYMVTSWKAVQELFGRAAFWAPRRRSAGHGAPGYRGGPDGPFNRGASAKNWSSESMTELAGSRPSTHERSPR